MSNEQISDDIKRMIHEAAMDVEVQYCIIGAMFSGCERGTDLWEYLEEDESKFKKETHTLLWGYDEEDENCIARGGAPHKVIEFLLDQVQARLKERLKV